MNDELTFNEILKINPDLGVKHPEYQKKVKDHSYTYYIPNWLKYKDKSMSGGYKVNHRRIMKELYDIGITPQIYYDIIILGLTDISQRPKCNMNGCNNSKFYNLNQGYQKFCCRSHQVKFNNDNISESTREKLRVSGSNHVVLEKDRYKLANLVKNNPDIKRKQIDKKIQNSIKRKIEKGILDKDGNPIPKEKKPRKKISLESRARISESKKLYYKNHPEKIHVNGFKRFNNKTGKEYSIKAGRYITYLSSWEREFIRFIDSSKEVHKIMNSRLPIRYFNPEKGKECFYFPDFYLELDDKILVVIEIKPAKLYYDNIVSIKRDVAKKYCEENNMYYITLTEYDLFVFDGYYKSGSKFNNELNLHKCISSQYNNL